MPSILRNRHLEDSVALSMGFQLSTSLRETGPFVRFGCLGSVIGSGPEARREIDYCGESGARGHQIVLRCPVVIARKLGGGVGARPFFGGWCPRQAQRRSNTAPTLGEVLAQNTARWATGGLHAMRPPVIAGDNFDMDLFRTQSSDAKQKTWCGWKYSLSNDCKLSVWDNALADPELCPRCFGKKPKGDEVSSSSGSSSS